MTRENREWKTFSQRWSQQSRFEAFLVASLIVHVGIALLVGVPVRSAQEEKKQLVEKKEAKEAGQKKEVEKLVEEAKREINEQLKKELAEAELKPVFRELTADFLDPASAQLYWDELLEMFDMDLDALAQMLAQPGQIAPIELEQKLQKLKAAMVPKLADLADRKQLDPAKKDIQAMAKHLAQNFKDGLEKKVGEPVGAQLEEVVQGEAQAAQAALKRASGEVAQLQMMTDKAAHDLARSQVRLEDLHKKQQQAESAPKKDVNLAAELRKATQNERAALLETTKTLRDVQAKLKLAEKDIAAHLPGAANLLKDTAIKADDGLGKETAEAAKQAQAGKAGEAGKNAQNARKLVEQAKKSLDQVQAALQLQLAGQMVDRLERDLAKQELDAKALAAMPNAKASKEFAKLAEQLAKRANSSAEDANKLALQVNEGEKQFAKALAKDVKSGLKGQAEKLTKDIAKAAELAKDKQPAQAADQLKAAGKQLQDLRKDIAKAQDKLGIKPGNSAEALLAKLAQMNEGLAKHADKQFAAALNDKALPLAMKNIQAALGKKLKAEFAANPKLQADLAKEVEKTLRKELATIQAGAVVAKAAAEKMSKPLPHVDANKPAGPHLANLANKAEAMAKQTLDKEIAALVDQGTKALQPDLAALGKPSGPAKESSFLNRLGVFQKQLQANRTDFLGRPSAAVLAALQRKAQSAQADLGRLGGMYIDPKAYQQIVEQIKDRGKISGDDLERRGAQGETSKARDESAFRPALVYLPDALPDEANTKDKKREVAPPAFKTNRFAGIPFLADDAIKIDGDLSDWKNLPSITLDPVTRGPAIKPVKLRPAQQTAYLAYCPRGILIAVDVVDTSGELENNRSFLGDFWLNDGIEIYLDTLNTKYARRGEPNTHQFFAFPFGDPKDDSGGYESQSLSVNGRTEWKRVPFAQEVMPRAGKKTENGWTMEMLIPKSILRRGEIKPGGIIGFNLQIDTGTNVYYFWSSAVQVQVSLLPETWGDIQFLGSDAKIELITRDGAKTQPAIVPGEPVHIRVTDPDMNLDDRVKDKISVTLRAASGDTETLILEETGPSTGVFTGSIGSRLNIGSRQPGVFEVFEGETAVIEYIDQARAFGERNLPIEATFRVGSAGTKLAR